MSVILQKLILRLQSDKASTLLFGATQVIVANLLASAMVRQQVELRLIVWQILAFSLMYGAAWAFHQSVCWSQGQNATRQSSTSSVLTRLRLLCYGLLNFTLASWILYATTAVAGIKVAIILFAVMIWLNCTRPGQFQQNVARASALALIFLLVFLNFLTPPDTLMWACCGLIFSHSLFAGFATTPLRRFTPGLIIAVIVLLGIWLHQMQLFDNQMAAGTEFVASLVLMLCALSLYIGLIIQFVRLQKQHAAQTLSGDFAHLALLLASSIALEVAMLAILAPQYGAFVFILMALLVIVGRPVWLAHRSS